MSTHNYSVDWFSQHIPAWEYALAEFKGKPIEAIELGSYEGRASVWLLENILTNPESHLECVDTWRGSEEHSETDMAKVKENFLNNIGGFDNVGYSECTSTEYLLDNQEPSWVDLIYIDASHRAADVLRDAVLSDLILKPGGVLIFDDYIWGGGLEHRIDTPRAAIDAFTECYGDQYDMIVTGVQLILKKKNNGQNKDKTIGQTV